MIDLNKPLKTREGRPVRIICTNKKANETSSQTLVGLVDHGTYERVLIWNQDGKYLSAYNGEFPEDLINE